MKLLHITHDLLRPGKEIDSRKRSRHGNLDALADSIDATGLLQPLVVRAKDGAWQIIAGNRRHAAIGKLIQKGKWNPADAIPCVERQVDEIGAREDSLVENLVREQLSPVEEFEAFRRLADDGSSVENIALVTGQPLKLVRQRMALGALHPEILDAFAKGEFRIAIAQAFTLEPDTERQIAVYRDLTKRFSLYEQAVRSALAVNYEDSQLLNFVDADAYRTAGGAMVEDLFGSNHRVMDPDLLRKLAKIKMDKVCSDLIGEGWSFALQRKEVEEPWRWTEAPPSPVCTEEEQARLDAINARLEELQDEDGNVAEGSEDEFEQLEAESDQIVALGVDRAMTAEYKAERGCLVHIDREGNLSIEKGCKRPTDAKEKPKAVESAAPGKDSGESAPEPEAKISAALLTDLWSMQTVAAGDALDWRLATALAIDALETVHSGPVKISNAGMNASRCPPKKKFFDRIKALLDLKDVALKARFTKAMASSLDLRSYNPNAPRSEEKALVDLVSLNAYEPAIKKTFDPERYFTGVNGKLRGAALDEMGFSASNLSGKKKADAVAFCVEKAKATGWVPKELRAAGMDTPAEDFAEVTPKKPLLTPGEEDEMIESHNAEGEYAIADHGAEAEEV